MRRGRPSHVKPLSTTYGQHKGKVIFIIGNSSSLEDIDMALMKPYTSIGINRLLRTYEPTYLFVVDRSVIEDEHKRMLASPCKKIIFRLAMDARRSNLYPGPHIEIEKMQHAVDVTSRKGPIHICRGGNSGYEACHVAFRMGAACIALAGIDMMWPKKRKSHFFGSGQKAGCHMSKPEQKIQDFGTMKRKYRKQGVEMVTVSPWKTPFSRVMEHVSLPRLVEIFPPENPA